MPQRSNRRSNNIINPLVPILLGLLLCAAIIVPPMLFTDDGDAATTLERGGYSNIKLNGYSPLGCTRTDDRWSTTFSATSPADASVTGIVCRSLLRGSLVIIQTTTDETNSPLSDLPADPLFLPQQH